MMNLYNAGSGKVRKVNDHFDPQPSEMQKEHFEEKHREERRAERRETENIRKGAEAPHPLRLSSLLNAKQISDRINSILPGNMNMEDLLLFIILMLLYLEKEDEEILIILSVLLLGDLNITQGKPGFLQ